MAHNPLITLHSFPLTPNPVEGHNSRGETACAAGPGATTLSWVRRGSVVAVLAVISWAYTLPTTPRRKIGSHVCARMCARVHARECASWCRGVVALSYLSEKKEEKSFFTHDTATTLGRKVSWLRANHLKNNKIFGIYCDGA